MSKNTIQIELLFFELSFDATDAKVTFRRSILPALCNAAKDPWKQLGNHSGSSDRCLSCSLDNVAPFYKKKKYMSPITPIFDCSHPFSHDHRHIREDLCILKASTLYSNLF